MKSIARTRTLAIALAAVVTGFAQPSQAADVTRDDVLSLFQTQQIDKNHDQHVSKKEFMDMMSKAWDMEAAKMKTSSGMMTLEQYKSFASMFNLNVGA